MNIDGSFCDNAEQEQPEEQQKYNPRVLKHEIENEANEHDDPERFPAASPVAGTGAMDVVMEMPTNFPEWNNGPGGVPSRRVSFPNDKHLVTGYMEPADPWANVKSIHSPNELLELYRTSCRKHHVAPLDRVVEQLDALQVPVEKSSRLAQLQLNGQVLPIGQCESLEVILKRIRYRSIDVSGCALDDTTATALFDMIEYYEAANELDISNNPKIGQRGLQACANMIRRCCSLSALYAHRIPVLEQSAKVLGNAMMSSSIHTLKLEYCKLSGRPIATLCAALAKNLTLKELWLASNELDDYDGFSLARLLKSNYYLQYLDISNNKIQDNGVSHIVLALIEQSQYFKNLVTSLVPVAVVQPVHQPPQLKESAEPANVDRNSAQPREDYSKKDVNDNVKSESDQMECDSEECREADNCDRLDGAFLGQQSGGGSSNKNYNEAAAAVQRLTNNKGIAVLTEEDTVANNNTTLSDHVEEEEGVEIEEEIVKVAAQPLDDNDDRRGAVDAPMNPQEQHQQPIVIEEGMPDGIVVVSPAIDINCNISMEGSTKAVATSDLDTSPKDLIDFNTSSTTVTDEEISSDQGEIFKLDEEETAERNAANVCNTSIISQQSTDADSGCESYLQNDNSFSTPPPQSLPKRFKLSSSSGDDEEPPVALKSERSLSSESLNSEASMESNDSKSSIRLMNSRFSKNGTLERQTTQSSVPAEPEKVPSPTGLQVLVLWSNLLSKKCGEPISDLLKATSTLEVLNVGKNGLGNDFVNAIKASLCSNDSVSKLGLQSIQLTCTGAKTVAEVIEAKCGSPLQRVDLRDNNIQATGLKALHDAAKCNTSITQIDLNAPPVPPPVQTGDGDQTPPETVERLQLIRDIREQCILNDTPADLGNVAAMPGGGKPHQKAAPRSRFSGSIKASRKISLTCQAMKPEFLIPAPPPVISSTATIKGASGASLLDPARKTSGRLKSPLPSPIPSPAPSPIPSPSRSRFQVSRVQESASLSPLTPPSSTSSSPTNSISRFRVTTVQETARPTIARSDAMAIPKGNPKPPDHIPLPKKPPQEENIFFGSMPAMELLEGESSKNSHHRTDNNKRLQSVSLDTISSSLDSPDLEVKRIMLMDDSSSVGSLDSYTTTTSRLPTATTMVVSSTESIDMAVKEQSFQIVEDSKMSVDSSVESISEKCNKLVLQEASSSSPKKQSELLMEGVSAQTTSDCPAASSVAATTTTNKVNEKSTARTRKTSWIPTNQATIDKLMSIFQNPFSRQSSPNDVGRPLTATTTDTTNNHGGTGGAGVSEHPPMPARKENSLGNLFNWAASGLQRDDKGAGGNGVDSLGGGGGGEDHQAVVGLSTSSSSGSSSCGGSKQTSVLNLANNTRGESNNNNNQNVRHGLSGPADVTQLGGGGAGGELMLKVSESLMKEMKENISPEDTITTSTLQQMRGEEGSGGGYGDLMRVKFRLGSTEELDELALLEESMLAEGLMEPEQMVQRGDSKGYGPAGGVDLMRREETCSSLDVETEAGGIGQIARDSMVILNTSSEGGGGSQVNSSPPVASQAE